MKKEEFFAFLDENLKEKPAEEQYDVLAHISSVWINEYFEKFYHTYVYCTDCQKYSKRDECVTKEVDEYRTIEYEGVEIPHYIKKRLVYCPRCNQVAERKILEFEVVDGFEEK